MRILFYNWVDYLDDEKRSGGVGVYQRNLITALGGHEGVETVFLSAGISYDIMGAKIRWERTRHGPDENRQNRYEIVNSGVVSPSHHSFGNPAQLEHAETEAVFMDFLERTGPYDVVHFNNLEGLPARVLALKERFPGTRVIFSMHNYYAVCPQVNLWFAESENCRDYDRGRKCDGCLPAKADERVVRVAHAVAFKLKKNGIRPGTPTFDRAFMPMMRVGYRVVRLGARLTRRGRAAIAGPKPRLQPPVPAHAAFQRRRKEFVALINAHCDLVLGVSDRVCDVAAHYGIAPELLRTSYIGTNQAGKFHETQPRPMVGPDGVLTLAYLGYMRRDKGFFFLLDALEALPDDLAARIRLVICARRSDGGTMARLAALSDRFISVRYADGYTHDDLDELLEGVGVGLVPVLWEDNLPQVAIEMHARHIPLLTSDMGGAREMGRCPQMVFRAGSIDDFQARIGAILDGEVDSETYWRDAMAPVAMETHIAELLTFYGRDLADLPPARRPRPLEPLQPRLPETAGAAAPA